MSFTNGRVYWSHPATEVLKGEVYLWSGKQMNGGNSDYTIAKTALESLKTADVALENNYRQVFAFDNKENKESSLLFIMDEMSIICLMMLCV